MKHLIHYILCIITLLPHTLPAIDNPHFYRATNFFLEPRIEHTLFTSFDATIGGGSTSTSRNNNHKTVPLFDIYGPHAIQPLGLDIPYPENTFPYVDLLQKLAALPQRPNFGNISIDGTFSITESNLSYTQNLIKGLLLFLHIPIRKLSIRNIQFIDASPDDAIFPNKNTPEWHNVVEHLPLILKTYNLNAHSQTEIGCGDLSCYLGWTHNYQDTKTLDFIDGTLMIGFLAPTGKRKNENALFSLPLGYNGHWGLPITGIASLGMYEWITLGAYLNTIIFADTIKTLPVKTNPLQSSLIKLTQADVSTHKGTIWHTGFYFKADHFVYGLSFTTAYSYATEQKTTLKPLSTTISSEIINTDQSLAGWNMHTVHFLAEYDFAKENSSTGKRIGLFYNYQVGGKRIFTTNVGGGSLGLDIAWDI